MRRGTCSSFLFFYLVFSRLEDDFDPVLVAEKLRAIGDALNDEARFRAVFSELQEAAAKEVSGERNSCKNFSMKMSSQKSSVFQTYNVVKADYRIVKQFQKGINTHV